jgi:acetylornithine aminotransferase
VTNPLAIRPFLTNSDKQMHRSHLNLSRRFLASSSKPGQSSKHSHLLKVYARPQNLCLERGKGCNVWDTNGKKYLDFTAGIAVNALGHADKGVSDVIKDQCDKLIHISNLYDSIYPDVLATMICEQIQSKDEWKGHKIFFSNSGTEANEGWIN